MTTKEASTSKVLEELLAKGIDAARAAKRERDLRFFSQERQQAICEAIIAERFDASWREARLRVLRPDPNIKNSDRLYATLMSESNPYIR